ncbi:hypothetical protein RB595_004445 [Gaeumannomyces hyphopodioides]
MALGQDEPDRPKKTVVFLHPDLGIGGAERLVVDAAVGLQNRGHKVVIFTSHCDPKHCFDEARDGTLDVRVRGNTLVPPSILSRFSILCAILRQLHLILHISFSPADLPELRPDAFFVDQLSAGLPLLSYLTRGSRPGILFYCHFPDLLLARGRAMWWKRLYRVPFDALEGWSMGFAHAVAVNSDFTRGVVRRTWPRLAASTELRVVYPCVDVKAGEGDSDGGQDKGGEKSTATLDWQDVKIVLSINRFERKKNIALAIKAFAGLVKEKRKGVKLVIAGGYDNRVPENVSYHKELAELAEGLGLGHATTKTVVTALALARDASVDVLFLLSVPSALKASLLKSARLLLYTPAEEHFGIVPLEAMLAGLPVLACDSGGPVETVVEGETGWLRDPDDVAAWTEVVETVLDASSYFYAGGARSEMLARMREAGPRRVRENFSDVQMAQRLEAVLADMDDPRARTRKKKSATYVFGSLEPFAFVLMAGIIVWAVVWRVASLTGLLE